MQSSPTVVSSSRVQCRTAPSWTDVRAPITMRLWSPRSTACGQIVDPAPTTTLPMIVASGWTNASGSMSGSMSPRAYSAMGADSNLFAMDVDLCSQRGRRAGLHDRRGRDRARSRRRAERGPRTARAVLRRPAVTELVRRPPHAARLQPARVRRAVPAHPGARARAADRRRRARPRLPDLVAVVDRDPAGRDGATHPRRRPADPAAEAAPADRVQLDVGADRLHRGERRHPARARFPPLGPLPRLRQAVRLDRGRDAEGLGADLARQPVARRRREHHRRRGAPASP